MKKQRRCIITSESEDELKEPDDDKDKDPDYILGKRRMTMTFLSRIKCTPLGCFRRPTRNAWGTRSTLPIIQPKQRWKLLLQSQGRWERWESCWKGRATRSKRSTRIGTRSLGCKEKAAWTVRWRQRSIPFHRRGRGAAHSSKIWNKKEGVGSHRSDAL